MHRQKITLLIEMNIAHPCKIWRFWFERWKPGRDAEGCHWHPCAWMARMARKGARMSGTGHRSSKSATALSGHPSIVYERFLDFQITKLLKLSTGLQWRLFTLVRSKLTNSLEGTDVPLKRDEILRLLSVQWHRRHGLKELRRQPCKRYLTRTPMTIKNYSAGGAGKKKMTIQLLGINKHWHHNNDQGDT